MNTAPPPTPAPEMVEIVTDEIILAALSRVNKILMGEWDSGWFVHDTSTARPENGYPGKWIAGPVSYEQAKQSWDKAQAAEIRRAALQSIDKAGFVIVPRDVLEQI